MGNFMMVIGIICVGLFFGFLVFSDLYQFDKYMDKFFYILFSGIFLLFFGALISNEPDSPQKPTTPQAKVTQCYKIENTQEKACVLELPDGTKTVQISRVKPETYVDFELKTREILRGL